MMPILNAESPLFRFAVQYGNLWISDLRFDKCGTENRIDLNS